MQRTHTHTHAFAIRYAWYQPKYKLKKNIIVSWNDTVHMKFSFNKRCKSYLWCYVWKSLRALTCHKLLHEYLRCWIFIYLCCFFNVQKGILKCVCISSIMHSKKWSHIPRQPCLHTFIMTFWIFHCSLLDRKRLPFITNNDWCVQVYLPARGDWMRCHSALQFGRKTNKKNRHEEKCSH